jgi:mRNA-degrading endonuclease RelE of RelBE toxin-antitoxin system
MRKILSTKLFEKGVKKLHPNEKEVIDKVIKKIQNTPEKGDLKKGDLAGVYTETFTMHGAQFRIMYEFSEDTITLLRFGPRENFYQ